MSLTNSLNYGGLLPLLGAFFIMDKLTICNTALRIIGVESIVSLDEGSISAELCNLFFDTAKNYILSFFPFNCARKRDRLAKLPSPAFGYKNAFRLPNDFLRLVQLNDRLDRYTIECFDLLTDANIAEIIYINKDAEITKLNSMVIEAITLQLAVKIGQKITNKAHIVQNLTQQLHQIVLPQAKINNNLENATYVQNNHNSILDYNTPLT